MHAAFPSVPVVTHLLDGLEQVGYEVERLALNPAFMARPDGVVMVMRFGEHVEGAGRATVARLEVGIDVHGDVDTGELHRWRIAKTFTLRQSSLLAIQLDAVFTLDGDISPDFIRQEGRVGLAMTRGLIVDATTTIENIRTLRWPNRTLGPIVHLEVKVAGEIAIGRTGLVPTDDGKQTTTAEGRAARLLVCEHLAACILPELLGIGASVARSNVRQDSKSAPCLIHATEAVPT